MNYLCLSCSNFPRGYAVHTPVFFYQVDFMHNFRCHNFIFSIERHIMAENSQPVPPAVHYLVWY